ncbi:hypothetical protein Tco_0455832 [Tanacetum coccineum]
MEYAANSMGPNDVELRAFEPMDVDRFINPYEADHEVEFGTKEDGELPSSFIEHGDTRAPLVFIIRFCLLNKLWTLVTRRSCFEDVEVANGCCQDVWTDAIDYLHTVWAHNNQHPSDLKPETDEKHGSDPEWEYGLKIELREPYDLDVVAVFEIMHESSTMIDIRIGKVKVPVKHFTGHAKKLSYPVLLSNGKSMGELIMSSMINTPDGDKCEDGDHPQAYIPTLEVPNGWARPSRLLSASNGIGLLALPLGTSNDRVTQLLGMSCEMFHMHLHLSNPTVNPSGRFMQWNPRIQQPHQALMVLVNKARWWRRCRPLQNNAIKAVLVAAEVAIVGQFSAGSLKRGEMNNDPCVF